MENKEIHLNITFIKEDIEVLNKWRGMVKCLGLKINDKAVELIKNDLKQLEKR